MASSSAPADGADALAAATDFTDKQFSAAEVAAKVVEQYDDAKTRLFYQIVMGARPRAARALSGL